MSYPLRAFGYGLKFEFMAEYCAEVLHHFDSFLGIARFHGKPGIPCFNRSTGKKSEIVHAVSQLRKGWYALSGEGLEIMDLQKRNSSLCQPRLQVLFNALLGMKTDSIQHRIVVLPFAGSDPAISLGFIKPLLGDGFHREFFPSMWL